MTDFDKILKLTNQFEYHLYAFASKNDLIEKFPEHQQDINRLNAKYIKWLDLRFGENPTIQEVHPIGDCISTLLKFQNKDSGISQKYTHNPEFKNQIDEEFPLDQRKWKNPSDPMSMTIDEMERILILYSRPKSKNTVEGLIEDPKDASYKLPTEDLVAKVGSWNIWLPSSRENSCKIAGYDPVTLKPFTTWCTARTEGSNLFYNYVGTDTMLFYLIKDNPTSDDDWLSVGFFDGEPILEGNFGGISVNRDNKGLTPESLQSILGGNYDAIMQIMQNKNNSLDNKSPAQIKIDEAAEDINKFKSLIKGNTESEAEDLKQTIAKITKNQEILELLAQDNNKYARESVARNIHASEKILELLLAQNNDQYTMLAIAKNPNINEKILEILANKILSSIDVILANKVLSNITSIDDKFTGINPLNALLSALEVESISLEIAKNPKANEKTLELLAKKNENLSIKNQIAVHPNTNQTTLEFLAKDPLTQMSVAKNRNASESILEFLVENGDKYTKEQVAKNPSTSEKILDFLARKGDLTTKEAVAKNPSASEKILDFLAREEGELRESLHIKITENLNASENTLRFLAENGSERLRGSMASNKEMNKNILEFLAINGSAYIKQTLAKNFNLNEQTFELLAKDGDVWIKQDILINPSITDGALKLLTEDNYPHIADIARKILKRRNSKQASHNLKLIKLFSIVNLFHKIVKSGEKW